MVHTPPHTRTPQFQAPSKLGLFDPQPGDQELVETLLSIMREQCMDFTNTFRDLSVDPTTAGAPAGREEFKIRRARWQERLRQQTHDLSDPISNRDLDSRREPLLSGNKFEAALGTLTAPRLPAVPPV
jgi:uncharacterized protein YdiU (UPF0061 family)